MALAAKVFWNPVEHRVRTFWRLTLQALLMVALVLLGIFLIAEPLTGLHKRGLFFGSASPDQYNHIINMIIGPILTVLVIASVWIAGRWLDHRKFTDFGLVLSRDWWTDFFFGLAMGALLMSGVFLYEYLEGWVVITGKLQATAGLSLSLALLFTLVKDLCVGIYEEVVARGYQLTNLMEGFQGFVGLGPRGAIGASIIVSSLIFGVIHGFNDNSSFSFQKIFCWFSIQSSATNNWLAYCLVFIKFCCNPEIRPAKISHWQN